MDRKQQIAGNLQKIKSVIDPYHANLIAVTKTYPASDIKIAYDLGQRHFGENKAQELLEKSEQLQDECPDMHWHFIGQLQSNKIKTLSKVPSLFAIHSLSSQKLVEKIITEKSTFKDDIKLFLQFNTSGEKEKAGFDNFEELLAAAKELHQNFNFSGLMTLGTIRTENFENEASRCFQECANFKSKLESQLSVTNLELSMGMSSDLEIALKNDSHWVRVGSAIFGKRS